MGVVLCCGDEAFISHETAAGLWGFRSLSIEPIEITVPPGSGRRPKGVRVHRRKAIASSDRRLRHGIPLTSPIRTLLDLAPRLAAPELERAVNDADRLDLVDPESLRVALDERAGRPGVAILRALLDRATFRLTDSELERRFLPIAAAAGLPPALTQQWVNGHRVDFFWPELGLVVETDGLRYHRTPAQQAPPPNLPW
jgi:hypothetical protein